MTSEGRTLRVSDEDEGSVADFAETAGISSEQTRDLIGRWGNDRSILTAEASKLHSST